MSEESSAEEAEDRGSSRQQEAGSKELPRSKQIMVALDAARAEAARADSPLPEVLQRRARGRGEPTVAGPFGKAEAPPARHEAEPPKPTSRWIGRVVMATSLVVSVFSIWRTEVSWNNARVAAAERETFEARRDSAALVVRESTGAVRDTTGAAARRAATQSADSLVVFLSDTIRRREADRVNRASSILLWLVLAVLSTSIAFAWSVGLLSQRLYHRYRGALQDLILGRMKALEAAAAAAATVNAGPTPKEKEIAAAVAALKAELATSVTVLTATLASQKNELVNLKDRVGSVTTGQSVVGRGLETVNTSLDNVERALEALRESDGPEVMDVVLRYVNRYTGQERFDAMERIVRELEHQKRRLEEEMGA